MHASSNSLARSKPTSNSVKFLQSEANAEAQTTRGTAASRTGQRTPRCFSPEGIAIDRAGNIFIAVTKHCVSAHFTCWWRAQDSFNSVIRRYNAATKTVGTYAGVPRPRWVGIDGPRAQATFWNPTSLALDRFGNLFVAGVNSLPL